MNAVSQAAATLPVYGFSRSDGYPWDTYFDMQMQKSGPNRLANLDARFFSFTIWNVIVFLQVLG